jgi:hypothetical protein
VIVVDQDIDIIELDLPEEMTMPFGGLLKDTIYNRVLAFITADPNSDFKVKEMAELVEGNRSKVGDALRDLEKQGILANISHDRRHPVYRPRQDSLRLRALVFLAYAVVDDRDGTSLMGSSVLDFAAAICRSSELTSNAASKQRNESGMKPGVASTGKRAADLKV